MCGPSVADDLKECRSRCGYNTDKPEAYFCPARSSTRSVVRAGYYAAGIGDPDHEEETRGTQEGYHEAYFVFR